MNKLVNLPDREKKAVIGLACIVIAQKNNGRFRSDAPECETVLEECFHSSWEGFHDENYKHYYLGNTAVSASSEMGDHITLISSLDQETQFAFKNLLIDIIDNNAMAMIVASSILQQIGVPSGGAIEKKEPPRTVRNTHEEGEPHSTQPILVQLKDLNAVRERDKSYTIKQDQFDDGEKLTANSDTWKADCVCPTNGMVGCYLPAHSVNTDEGTLHFVICDNIMVIPVLEWGLETIDEWQFQEKRQHNRVLSFDQSGQRIKDFLELEKHSHPSNGNEMTKHASDSQVVHFEASTQTRVEGGRDFTPNYITRRFRLTYTKLGSELKLECPGVFQPRLARIEGDDGRILTYRDKYNPSCYYEVETNPSDNTITRVSIFQINQDYELVEYRYK